MPFRNSGGAVRIGVVSHRRTSISLGMQISRFGAVRAGVACGCWPGPRGGDRPREAVMLEVPVVAVAYAVDDSALAWTRLAGGSAGRAACAALAMPGRMSGLADGLEGVVEVVFGDLAAEGDAGDAGEAVVQPGPEPGVDDLAAEVAGRGEVPHRVQVPGRPGGVEAVDVQADLAGARGGGVHLRRRCGGRAGRSGGFGGVGGVRQRSRGGTG